MATTTTTPAPAPVTGPAPTLLTPAAGASVRTMAIVLWAVVGSALTYGIVMTALKASALFS
jgi:hypothetical protein